MHKLISSIGFLFFFILHSITLSAQSNSLWRGFASYATGSIEPNEVPCDIIQNGQLRIAPALAEQPDYLANFTYLDTVCLSRDFSLEFRVKNNTALGGVADHDCQISLFSNGLKTSLLLTNAARSQANTVIRVGDSILLSNHASLVTDLSDWRVVKMLFFNSIFQLSLDGVEIFKSPYSRTICNLDIMKFALKGGGAIDWVKIYDNNNTLFWQEDFNDCRNQKRGIICDPFRLDKSVTISRPCQNDTLSLKANFPAMSYRWTTPQGKIDTHQFVRTINPTSGLYDLIADVNTCFVFFKSIPVIIDSTVNVTQNIRLCTGQSYTLCNGRQVTTSGSYKCTTLTKLGCDSIITTNLIFEESPVIKINASTCSGAYVLPCGRVVTTAGVYRDNCQEANGCYRFYEVTLTVEGNNQPEKLNATICSGVSYTLPSGKKVTATGVYRDSIKDNNCFKFFELNLTVKDSLIKNVAASICEGVSYQLPNGQIVYAAGTYRSALKTTGGCDSVIVTTITFSPKPKIKITSDKSNEVLEGEGVILSIPSGSVGTITWYEDNKPSTLTKTQFPVFIKGGETQYRVVLNASGCEAVDSIKIIGLPEVQLPNVFTPNEDGLNDYFNIIAKNENIYKIVRFSVFNRLGKEVYSNVEPKKGWNGKYFNEDMVSDMYLYAIILQSPSGRTFKFNGEVLLLR